MNRRQIVPYLRPKAEHVIQSEWLLFHHEDTQPITEGFLLDQWDARHNIRAGITVQLNARGVFEDCRLSDDAMLRLICSWHSSGTMLRGIGEFLDIDQYFSFDKKYLKMFIPGKQLSKSVDLTVSLILIDTGRQTTHALSPKIPGTLLWKFEQSIQLEGEGARFPMEPVDFSEIYHAPDDAVWFLEWDPNQLEQLLLKDVVLYVNTRNERVINALAGEKDAEVAIREAVLYEVAKTLILGALENADFVRNPEQYPSGSIGAAVWGMIHTSFPSRRMQDIKSEASDLRRFEPQLQQSLKLFWEEK